MTSHIHSAQPGTPEWTELSLHGCAGCRADEHDRLLRPMKRELMRDDTTVGSGENHIVALVRPSVGEDDPRWYLIEDYLDFAADEWSEHVVVDVAELDGHLGAGNDHAGWAVILTRKAVPA